ncbi:MAG: monofunctional biosynthetic peptidoglycan transglycosylase [Ignavibacteria bacterium]|jgi:monofunctional biosynthetic peptidoglycan transglycosylase|nr:monofunctional biosynthetic peptidoglycan transglycosylase [Ignavibacteria bacterium]
MIKKIFFWILKLLGAFFLLSILTVLVYKFVNPPFTPLMLIRVVEGALDGELVGVSKEWKDYDDISKNVFRAVISSEDAKFLKHGGFDWKAIENAKKYNEKFKGKKVRGASTISMQTAKNVFLWQSRNYVRKALEAYFTVLIEYIWGKKRILEVYVNVIEMGAGVYGIEAASQKYFQKSASDLTKREAALIAAILPNPRYRSAASPTPYLEKRQAFIQKRMNGIALPKTN